MKLLKTLTLGLMAAAATVGSASAVTIIHVAGSTAFRSGASVAIMDTLAGTTLSGGAGSTPVYAAYSNKNICGANAQIYANGTIGTSGTATIIVEAYWTGSLAGLVDVVAGQSTAAFPNETDSGVISAVNSGLVNVSGGTYLGAAALPAGYATHQGTVELAQSDSIKTTISKELATGTLSGTLGSYSSITSLASAVGGSLVADAGTSGGAGGQGAVAVVPFEWVISNITTSGYTAPTNMSQQVAKQLFTGGFVDQSEFTGTNNAADTANYYYLTGRNEDSGTRIGGLSESQFGVTTPPLQYQVGNDSNTLTGTGLFPANSALNTEPQISWAPAGHTGYATGGNVAAALDIPDNGATLTFTGKPGGNTGSSYFVGYLGVTDAATAIGSGAKALTYNGVAYSPTAVQNGSYSFWTYEHSYRLASLSGTTLTVVNNIADILYAADADVYYDTQVEHASDGNGNYVTGSAGVFLYDMNVSRSTTEGGAISHN
jgi:hypothetical protein